MPTDIAELSVRELDALITKAKQRRTILVKRKSITVVRKRFAALAEAEGYSLAELAGGQGRGAAAPRAAAKKGRKFGKVAPKYRNPANRQETWTGRGKRPRWLAALVEQGKKVEEFLIDNVGGVRKSASRSKQPATKKAKKEAVQKGARKTVTKRTGKAVRSRRKPVAKKA